MKNVKRTFLPGALYSIKAPHLEENMSTPIGRYSPDDGRHVWVDGEKTLLFIVLESLKKEQVQVLTRDGVGHLNFNNLVSPVFEVERLA